MVKCFKKWKVWMTALSTHGDEMDMDKQEVIESIKHLEPTLHSGPSLEDIYVTKELMETTLATVTAVLMENQTALATMTAVVMEIKGSLHTTKSPRATTGRAEEAELSNQKQICVADLEPATRAAARHTVDTSRAAQPKADLCAAATRAAPRCRQAARSVFFIFIHSPNR